MKRPHASLIVFLFIFLALFSSCSKQSASGIDRVKLFTLSYGRFEDQIDLFQLSSGQTGPDSQLFMKDGMFYVVNSGAKKILQLTSFGDLLAVYYNPETNPPPSFTALSLETPGATTRKAVAYPFNHPVFITVDNQKRLFVVDEVPQERQEFDNDEQVLLRNVVLRFDSDGDFVDYLGQEGPGGTPFPPVSGIYSTERNELVVVTKSQTGTKVFWYNPEGNLLFRVPVLNRSLPTPYETSLEAYPSLEKIIPDSQSRTLYLKIDYYTETVDEATKANAGISFDRSAVYPFSIDNGKFGERIDLPVYEGVDKDKLGTFAYKKPYELLGITGSGWVFLSTPSENGYVLEIMDKRTHRIHKRSLTVLPEELMYNALHLSPDGIISALLATEFEAPVVWWRTDEIIGEVR